MVTTQCLPGKRNVSDVSNSPTAPLRPSQFAHNLILNQLESNPSATLWCVHMTQTSR